MNRLIKSLSLFLLLSMSSISLVYAAKVDMMFGAYSYAVDVQGKSSSLSGAGVYEMSYLVAFKENFELNLGYSFTMSGVVGGDYSYGPKIGVNYFPFNFSSNEKIMLPNKTIEVHDFYRPYVGIAFNQRQYQSVKASYAGLGMSLGCEKYISPKYTVKTELKFNSYTGASNAKATEKNLLVGLVLGF